MNKLIETAKTIAAAAAAEGRPLSDEERATVEQALAGAKALKADKELAEAVNALGSDLAAVKPEATPVKGGAGKQMLADPAFKAWLASATANGSVDAKSLPNSPSVSVGGIKATLLGGDDDYAGALIDAQRYAPVEQAYARELNVLRLITSASTNSDVVEYARVMNFGMGASVNAAAPTAEGDASPESTMKFVKLSAPVRDVRTFIPASTRALSDAAQLQSLVDSFIRYSIQDTLADQIINGDGTGENMEGILEVSGTQTQAFDTDAITTIRRAIRKVRHTGNGAATAVLLNPEDDENIDLLNDSGVYLFGGPAGAATPTIWGLPRVVDAAVPAGVAIVGDFRQLVLFQRSPLSVAVYPQHSDYALKGLVAIAGTARAALACLNPAKFVIADLTA